MRFFNSISQRVFLVAVLCLRAGAGAAEPDAGSAQRDGVWKAGVAKVVITPDKPLWMAGFGARTNVSRGTLQELYAKALALEDQDGRRSVLVTTDLVGFPAPVAKTIADRVNKPHGLSRERLILNSSHTHSGPQLSDRLVFWSDWRMSPEQVRDIEHYTRGLEDKVVAVIGTALSHLQPARLSFGRTAMRFAVNRRLKTEQGYYRSFVPNPAGPVDHDVPLLRKFLRASANELQRHAQELLKILDRDGHLPTEYPYPLQIWQFGSDLTLVALAGEPVVDYALRLRKELGADRLWVAGYCNDVFAYIPSLRVLQEGGYEGGGAIVGARLPGPFAPSVEETIVRKVHELVERLRTK